MSRLPYTLIILISSAVSILPAQASDSKPTPVEQLSSILSAGDRVGGCEIIQVKEVVNRLTGKTYGITLEVKKGRTSMSMTLFDQLTVSDKKSEEIFNYVLDSTASTSPWTDKKTREEFKLIKHDKDGITHLSMKQSYVTVFGNLRSKNSIECE